LTLSMVRLNHVVKIFDDQDNLEAAAVNDISLEIREGEFLTILGPSGCGKTTTLRMIAGFEKCTNGDIFIDNENVSDKAPYERQVNTVFQNYALFPHMNVYDNIAFALSIKKAPKREIEEKVSKLLKTVQLEGMENRMPDQLSGGQKQRVAIARAVINNPKVLLLDEPLGALDQKLRKQMQVELKHLQQKLGITFVFVTHDQEEALIMSDRICVMNNGSIEQFGTPDEIYERPKTRFVADFIGETNFFEGIIKERKENYSIMQMGSLDVATLNGVVYSEGTTLCFAIRPERLKLKASPTSDDCYIKAFYKERIYVGSVIKTVLTLNNGKQITISEASGDIFDINASKDIFVTWKSSQGVVIN